MYARYVKDFVLRNSADLLLQYSQKANFAKNSQDVIGKSVPRVYIIHRLTFPDELRRVRIAVRQRYAKIIAWA